MAESDVDLSSKDPPSQIREQITTRIHLLSTFGSTWMLVKWALGISTDCGNTFESAEAVTEALGDQLDGSQTANAPNIKRSRKISLQNFKENFKEAFLTEQLLQALSDPDQAPVRTTANDGGVLASNILPRIPYPDSSAQHAPPAPLFNHLHEIYETVGLTNDLHIDETAYRSMSGLVDELRKREIFQYLVPHELEGTSPFGYSCYALTQSLRTDEFYRIKRTQLALGNRGDNIARIVTLAGYWLHKCCTDHPECPRLNFSSGFWPKLPNRVIDLSYYQTPPFSPESRVNVIETNGSRGPYVALSYRWPLKIQKSSMLSRSTLEKLTQGIAACDLLSEIQDACTLAKGLGIQYLWVDALVRSMWL
jgi:hypothetical protein